MTKKSMRVWERLKRYGLSMPIYCVICEESLDRLQMVYDRGVVGPVCRICDDHLEAVDDRNEVRPSTLEELVESMRQKLEEAKLLVRILKSEREK